MVQAYLDIIDIDFRGKYFSVRVLHCTECLVLFNGDCTEKNGKEAPVWGVAQFGETSYPGSQTRVESGRPKPKK